MARRIKLKFDPVTGVTDEGGRVLDAGSTVPRFYFDASGKLRERTDRQRCEIAAMNGELPEDLFEWEEVDGRL